MKIITLCIGLLTIISTTAAIPPQGSLDQKMADLSAQIVREMSEKQKTIAIADFSMAKGNLAECGQALSEELITQLYRTRGFTVVERSQLQKVIAEQKLTLTGAFASKSAKKLGNLLGVDAIATGTITEFAHSLKINARLISTETGELFAVASIELPRDDSLPEACRGRGYTRPRPPGNMPKVEEQEFLFQVIQCEMSNTTVICDLTVTNKGQDRNLSISARNGAYYAHMNRTVLHDNLNNQYVPAQVRMGNKVGTTVAKMELVSGLQVGVALQFEGVSPNASSVSKLELGCYSPGTLFRPELRNIPLTKRE